MSAQRSRTLWFIGVAVFVVFVDQLLKNLVIQSLTPGVSQDFIGSVLRLRLTFNDSAAFSLGWGVTWFFTLVSSVAALVLLWESLKVKTRNWALLGGVLLGGVTGNLLDRLLRAPGFPNGHVVDYLQIPFNFPIFNLADCCICVGIALIAIAVIRGKKIGG